MNVSVLIPAKNESLNLPDCLRSVAWADEVVVVDSHSSDETRSIAERAGARVIDFDFQPGGPRKKNWALQSVKFAHPWVLLLDADERVPPSLRDEILDLANDPPCDGYYINRRLMFLGRWIRHSGWYPSWNLRLLRVGAGQFETLGTEQVQDGSDVEIHEHLVVPSGRVEYLKNDLIHDDFRDLHHFLEKHNRYSTWEARVYQNLAAGTRTGGLAARLLGSPLERKRAMKRLWVHLPCRPFLRFIYMYLLRGGILDGMPGYIFCRLMSQHEFHIWAKAWEQTRASSRGESSRVVSKRNEPQQTASAA